MKSDPLKFNIKEKSLNIFVYNKIFKYLIILSIYLCFFHKNIKMFKG